MCNLSFPLTRKGKVIFKELIWGQLAFASLASLFLPLHLANTALWGRYKPVKNTWEANCTVSKRKCNSTAVYY